MNYTNKSERLLKYQKTKAKLIEYDVPKDAYPHFPISPNDLSFSTVYILSLYAESLISDNTEKQVELRPLLIKVAQYYDSAFEAKDRMQHDQDFLITGAAAYFLHNDFGSAKVLCAKVNMENSIINSPFHLLTLCMRYLLIGKYQRFISKNEQCREIYKAMVSYFRSGENDAQIFNLLIAYRQYVFENGNAMDSFYVDILYATLIFAVQKALGRFCPCIRISPLMYGGHTWRGQKQSKCYGNPKNCYVLTAFCKVKMQ